MVKWLRRRQVWRHLSMTKQKLFKGFQLIFLLIIPVVSRHQFQVQAQVQVQVQVPFQVRVVLAVR